MTENAISSLKLSEDYTLALSGGGIRSATISLGIAQGLAKADALGGLKMLSTVSGGGYFGSFFKSLYMPSTLRGLGAPEKNGDLARIEYVKEVLSADAHEQLIDKYPNPVQWLRNHSRFLAPSGTGDYWFAAAVLMRNWLGMIYVFLLAIGIAITTSIWMQIGLRWLFSISETESIIAVGARLWPTNEPEKNLFVPSAWFALAGLLASFWAVFSTAFWHTEMMLTNPSKRGWSVKKLNVRSGVALLALSIPTVVGLSLLWWVAICYEWLNPNYKSWESAKTWWIAFGVSAFILLSLAAAWLFLASVVFSSKGMGNEPYPLTSELRQRLTAWTGTLMRATLVVGAFAAIDTAAMNLYQQLNDPESGAIVPTLASPAIATALAALVHRLASASGGTDSPLLKWVARHLTFAALVLAVVLWAILAILAGILVHAAFWKMVAWSEPQFPAALLLTAALGLLACLVVWSDGFINLSSLHGFYASRLTRAYLGASNAERFDMSSSARTLTFAFNKTHPKDYLEADSYFQSPGPEHIVNIALNETIDTSTGLPERDRMSTILSIGADGMRVGSRRKSEAELRTWAMLEGDQAERISVGQWIAISGAAVTSGMGRMTSIGGALLLTFANLRLGYWWRKAKANEHMSWTRFFGPFRYLHAEMTARYRRDTYRVYLSDGGHFENSGAYGILMRHGTNEYRDKIPQLMIVADNGQDGRYTFADLEQLVRRARLDLGWSIEPEASAGVKSRVSGDALRHFLNRPDVRPGSVEPDWRERATSPGDSGFALLLNARKCGTDAHMTIIWLKPCRIAGVSVDVAAYGEAHPSFPHESTGNQFFDEEQFESYRKLGQQMIERLAADL